MRLGYRSLATLVAIATLSLLVPQSALVAQQQSKAEQALTCTGIYYALADSKRDPALIAIQDRYRILAGVSAAEAERAGTAQGKAMLGLIDSGKLTEAELIGGAGACTRIFQIAQPRHTSRVATGPAPARPPVSAPQRASTPAPDTGECDRADKAFTAEMYTQADKLAEAGPRYTDECENGSLCGVKRPRSQFYYALGKACDALKARQKAASRVCPAARVREMTIPEELGC